MSPRLLLLRKGRAGGQREGEVMWDEAARSPVATVTQGKAVPVPNKSCWLGTIAVAGNSPNRLLIPELIYFDSGTSVEVGSSFPRGFWQEVRLLSLCPSALPGHEAPEAGRGLSPLLSLGRKAPP